MSRLETAFPGCIDFDSVGMMKTLLIINFCSDPRTHQWMFAVHLRVFFAENGHYFQVFVLWSIILEPSSLLNPFCHPNIWIDQNASHPNSSLHVTYENECCRLTTPGEGVRCQHQITRFSLPINWIPLETLLNFHHICCLRRCEVFDTRRANPLALESIAR